MNDFIILTDEDETPVKKNNNANPTFCYWSVADGKHALMMETLINSAREVGVKEDFHVWSDRKIDGAINHDCGNFDKSYYLFKFEFLRKEVSKLNYDYFIFLDADNYFVRDPGDILSICGTSPIFVCMENDCTSPLVKRQDWWGCKIDKYPNIMRSLGVKSDKIYNTNAGLWIVKKDVIEEFYQLGMSFWNYCHHSENLKSFTEEPALAYIGHMLSKNEIENHTLEKTCHIWASDWTKSIGDKLPDGTPWFFEDFMTGEKRLVNPAIVHVMRNKEALIKKQESLKNKVFFSKNDEVLNNCKKGFWMGHRLLGDVFGFCAAAHLLHKKTNQIIKIHYPQEHRKGISTYFSGIRWVKKEEIPDAIDCGADPRIEDWVYMNGVKRFYRFMDKTLTSPISFDIHMCIKRYQHPEEKLIGLVSYSVTQGPIDDNAIEYMCLEAKKKYPEHKIILLGEKKNKFSFPEKLEIEDRRVSEPDFDSLVEQIRNLELLLTPQSGPCFIAAGLGVPMWVYRSKLPHWDYVLNYDVYKVERWFERNKDNKFDIFDKIYKRGGWSNKGSGPGSDPNVYKEYASVVSNIIKFTPNIKTILDVGCGDFKIMTSVDMSNKEYVGIDVSQTIINENNKLYSKENIKFLNLDVTSDEIPEADIIIIKDVLQHLPNDMVKNILNLVKTKCKYALITNDYTDKNLNNDIEIGKWRKINVLISPYDMNGVTVFNDKGKQTSLSFFGDKNV